MEVGYKFRSVAERTS